MLVVLISVIVIIVTLSLLFGKDLVKKNIQSRLNEIESLDYSSLEVSLFPVSLQIENIEFDDQYLSVKSAKFAIRGIEVLPLVFSEKININQILIEKPSINYRVVKDTLNQQPKREEQEKYEKSPDFLIDKIIVEDGDFSLLQYNVPYHTFTASYDFTLKGLDTTFLNNIQLLPRTIQSFQIRQPKYLTKDSIYTIQADLIHFHDSVSKIRVDSFKTSCNFPKYQFARNKGYSVDWIKLNIPVIEIIFENFEELINDRRIRNLDIQKADMLVFKDKRVPDPEKSPLILREILAKEDVSFYVDSVNVRYTDIIYEEWEKKARETGKVVFNSVEARITDLITFDHQPENPARLTATCLLFDKGKLYADISFPLTYNGKTLVKGKLDSMPLSTFNQMLRPAAFVEVRSGQLKSLDFEFSHDRMISTGEMEFAYEGLEIAILGDQPNPKGFRKFLNNLISTVVSTFVLKPDNMPGFDEFRNGDIYFERNMNKSIFNYWWKSIFSGLKSSVGISEEKNNE